MSYEDLQSALCVSRMGGVILAWPGWYRCLGLRLGRERSLPGSTVGETGKAIGRRGLDKGRTSGKALEIEVTRGRAH